MLDDGWVSATELAEYAYCPRSLYYHRRHPDADEPRAARDGRAFHERTLGAARRREGRGGVYWAGALLGLALLVAATVELLR